MSIQDLIASVNDRLTPTERRIAEAVTADPSLLAFGTVSDLARRVATSPPSIVRFAAKLGFEGFRDLQTRARDGVTQQLTRPSHRIRNPAESAAPPAPRLSSSPAGSSPAATPETCWPRSRAGSRKPPQTSPPRGRSSPSCRRQSWG